MKRRLLQIIGPLLTIVVLGVALYAMHHLLRNYHYRDVVKTLRELPRYNVLLALGFTILSYFLLTLYDTLGVRTIEHPLPYHRIAVASFIGYAFNNNLGFGGLAGNSLRYRIYTSWGLTTEEVFKVIGFCVMTFWMGFLAVAGLSFLIDPVPIPAGLHLPIHSLHPVGAVLLVPVVAYLVLTAFYRKPFTIGGWSLSLPRLRISLMQIGVACLDWAAAAAVFYVLLNAPGHTGQASFPQVLGLFLLAQITGLISHVPGGVGVFDAVILLGLSSENAVIPHPFTQPQVLGALLAYRGIYYLLPLGTAVVLLGAHEIVLRLEHVRRTVAAIGQWAPGMLPNVFAFATFVAGALLLFTGATPGEHARLRFLHTVFPGGLLEMAHLLSSMLGAAFLLLARGLQRRLDSAWLLTVALFVAALPASLLRGDYEATGVLFVILLAFIPSRPHFYRKASLLGRHSISTGWAVAIGLTIVGSIWVGLFSYKRIPYSAALWSHFAITERGDFSKFMRASVGAIGVVVLYGLKILLKPAPMESVEMSEADWQKVRTITEESPRTYAWSALLRDKQILFNKKGNAFIMYGIEGRSWVALGDPVGPDEEKDELAWQFRELSDAHGGWTVFYHIVSEHLPLYLDLGLVLLKLGEEAMVPLDTFTVAGSANKDLRQAVNRFTRDGYRFEILPREAVPELLPRLKAISDCWLESKNTREKGFSLGFFSDAYLKEFPLAVVLDANGQIVAFANVWAGAGKEELSIDMMRYLPDIQPGVMDYLFTELMLWGREQGYKWFNLGMAPLSGLENRTLAPLWTRIGSMIFRHGEHFYNFRGLRQYKEKFDPVWVPKYLASPGGIALPRVLTNIAALISQGLKGIVTK